MKYRLIIAPSVALAATIAWAVVVPVNGGSLDFSLLYPGASVETAFPSCNTTTSSGLTTVTPPTPGENCNIQPDEQTVSIYRLALCTSKPSAPTISAASSISACNFIFTSTSITGSPVSIVLNETAALTNGAITKPANGTYTHLYLEIDPEVKIKSVVKFTTAMGDSNGESSGVYCWSTLATTYNFSMNTQGSFPLATVCGNSTPVTTDVAATSSLYNSLMDDSQNGGTGFTNAFVNLPTTAGGPGTLDAYLIGTDGKLVTTQTVNTIGSVKRIAAFMTLPSPGVVVTDASTSFVLGYNNTKGAQVSTQSSVTPSRVSKFGNGPFDMTVTVN